MAYKLAIGNGNAFGKFHYSIGWMADQIEVMAGHKPMKRLAFVTVDRNKALWLKKQPSIIALRKRAIEVGVRFTIGKL